MGSGLALVVVGLVGLACVGLIAAGLARRIHIDQAGSTYVTRHAAFGQFITMQPEATQLIGTAEVDVYSLRYPVAIPDPGTSVPTGYEWALADVSECAGATGPPAAPDAEDFAVLFNGGPGSVRGKYPDPGSIPKPALNGFTSVAPDRCVRGYVSFLIPVSPKPIAVRYEPLLRSFDRYEWDVTR
jgi:hypothetical protein